MVGRVVFHVSCQAEFSRSIFSSIKNHKEPFRGHENQPYRMRLFRVILLDPNFQYNDKIRQ